MVDAYQQTRVSKCGNLVVLLTKRSRHETISGSVAHSASFFFLLLYDQGLSTSLGHGLYARRGNGFFRLMGAFAR